MTTDPLFGPASDPNYVGPAARRGDDEPNELGDLHGSQELSQRHREIIRLAFLGRTQTEIAERMSMDRSSIRLILQSPLAQAELSRLNDKAETILVNTPLRVALDKDLRDAATESLRLNRAVVNDPKADLRVRTKTAQHFMDRIIFGDSPDEKDGSYRDILRRLDTIDRNVRMNGSGVALFPPGSLKDILAGGEEIKDVSPRDSDGPRDSDPPEHGRAG